MKIIVCIKQVPDAVEIKFDAAQKTIVREGVRAIINPFDRSALSLAIHLKQRFAAHVTVVTMGPPQAREALYEALAAGCDHAVHLCDPALAGADTLATARALAALARGRGFDLILCGKHTIDGETAQVGPELAELLHIPHISGVHKVEWTETAPGRPTGLTACQESDDGEDSFAAALPCLLSTAEHLLPPIPVGQPAIQAARAREVQVCSAAELGLRADEVGALGSPTWVAEIRSLPPAPRPPVQMCSGTPAEVARELLAIMRTALEQGKAAAESIPALAPDRALLTDKAVWVVVQSDREGRLIPGSRELLGEAAVLAAQLQGAVAAVVLGPCPESLPQACAAQGADVILHLHHPALAEYSNERYSAALSQVITDRNPFAVFFSSTERGRDLAPRVAARLQAGLVGDAIGLTLDERGQLLMLKPAFSGSIVAPILSRTRPQMATVRPGVFSLRLPLPARPVRIEKITLGELPPGGTQLVHSEATLDEQAARLLSAKLVVGVGMGIGDPRHLPLLHSVTAAFDGSLCATRRVTDKGWMPRQLQVGLTGKVIAPVVYLAVGIRGVPNHTIGIQRAGTILAINNDPKAQIFKMANYGVVGDWTEIVTAMASELKGS